MNLSLIRRFATLFAVSFVFLAPAGAVFAATVTSTTSGGDWGTASTWVGNRVPATGDTVIIATTGTNNVQVTDPAVVQTSAGSVTVDNGSTLSMQTAGVDGTTFGALTINSGGTVTAYRDFTVLGATNITGTINFGSTSSTNRLATFDGDVTLNSGAVWNETTTGAVASFDFGGNLTNNATTFTAQNNSAAIHTFTGTAKTISGTTTTAIPYLTISGTTTNNGTLTVSSTLAGAGTLTNGASGTLNFGGSSITPTLTATASGNTVNYNGTAQTVKATTYSNLTLSGSGAKSMAAGTSVGGNLSIAPTGSPTASVATGQNLTVNSLELAGLSRINGEWGSTTSSATHQNNTYFAATTGRLNVSADTRTIPTINTAPTATGITYGQALSASTLSGGSASVSGGAGGGFAFTSPSTLPDAGTYNASVTFTPEDLTSYTTTTTGINVAVAKANPDVTSWPTATSISYGQTLNDSSLNGGSATPTGNFAFTVPSTVPSIGTASQSVTYTPTDTTDYNTAVSTVSVTVISSPTVTNVNPSSGLVTGGTGVTITGTQFMNGATVEIGGNPATDVDVVGDTAITATVPSGIAGPADVEVTNPDGGTATDVGSFTYTALSSDTAITSFDIGASVGTVNNTAHTVAITVPFGTNVTDLSPTIVLDDGSATISPISGTSQDFTNPVTYTVTAENSSTQTYTVTVTVAPSNDTAITSFDIGASVGTVNNTADTVDITVPFGTDLTDLSPTIVLDDTNATISPTSGTSEDFSGGPVTYTVTAENSSTQTYVVTVNVGLSGELDVNNVIVGGPSTPDQFSIEVAEGAGSPGSSFAFDVDSSTTGHVDFPSIPPDTYTVIESTIAPGYVPSYSSSCSSGILSEGSTLTCTITNTYVAPTADAATNVTLTDATMNATNGADDATQVSFWVSPTSPIDTSSSGIPSGVYSTPVTPNITANASFSDQLSLVTTNGIVTGGALGNMPKITPNTTYYYVPWALVNGTWYPGLQQSVTTAASTDDTLSNLAVDQGTLSSGFTSGNLTYTDSVPANVTTLNVTPTTNDSNATVTVNGNAVTSGDPSSVALSYGSNTITINVMAQDGSTNQNYTITVTRGTTNNGGTTHGDALSALTVDSGTLSPAFSPTVMSYTDSVANGVSTVTITPTAADPSATVIVNNGNPIVLTEGATTTVPVVVSITANSTTYSTTYDVAVGEAPSNDDTLSSLAVDNGTLSPGFDSGTLSYTETVPASVTTLTVTPTTNDSNASVTVNGNSASTPVTLNYGNTTVTVDVTAQDGVTTQNYIITVSRGTGTGDTLANLVVDGTTVPSLISGTNPTYSESVASTATSTSITPTLTDTNANVTLTVNGVVGTSGVASIVNLSPGLNTIPVVVSALAGNGTTYSQTYNVAVTQQIAPVTPVVTTPNGGGGGGPLDLGIVNGAPTGSTGGSTGGQVLGAQVFQFTTNLHYGMISSDVTQLQTLLIKDGYLKVSAPTGYFGPLTLAAVKKYQTANKIPDTGFVGPLTRAALNLEEQG